MNKKMAESISANNIMSVSVITAKLCALIGCKEEIFNEVTEKDSFIHSNGKYDAAAHRKHIGEIFGIDLSSATAAAEYMLKGAEGHTKESLKETYEKHIQSLASIERFLLGDNGPFSKKFWQLVPHVGRRDVKDLNFGFRGPGMLYTLPVAFHKIDPISPLERLAIRGDVKSLPENLGKLTKLRSLGFYGKQFTEIPAFIKDMTVLRGLTLPSTCTELPKDNPFPQSMAFLDLKYIQNLDHKYLGDLSQLGDLYVGCDVYNNSKPETKEMLRRMCQEQGLRLKAVIWLGPGSGEIDRIPITETNYQHVSETDERWV